MIKAYLFFSGPLGMWSATPVHVLSQGPKRSRVRLRHLLRWNRKTLPAGTTRYVPTESLGNKLHPGVLLSRGRGVYRPWRAKNGRLVRFA